MKDRLDSDMIDWEQKVAGMISTGGIAGIGGASQDLQLGAQG